MSPPLVKISTVVAPAVRAELERLGGEDGISSAARIVIGLGLKALHADPDDLARCPIEDLRQITDALAAVTGRHSPAGGWWCPTDAALPDPNLLDPRGDCIVTPNLVLLAGAEGSFLVEADPASARLGQGNNAATLPLDVEQLPNFAVMFSAAVLGACNSRTPRSTPGGLAVELLENGVIAFAVAGVMVTASVPSALVFAAELHGLAAHRVARSVMAREALERQLAGAGHG